MDCYNNLNNNALTTFVCTIHFCWGPPSAVVAAALLQAVLCSLLLPGLLFVINILVYGVTVMTCCT